MLQKITTKRNSTISMSCLCEWKMFIKLLCVEENFQTRWCAGWFLTVAFFNSSFKTKTNNHKWYSELNNPLKFSEHKFHKRTLIKMVTRFRGSEIFDQGIKNFMISENCSKRSIFQYCHSWTKPMVNPSSDI